MVIKTPTQIKQLRPDPKNARLHNERNIGTIAAALTEVGPARSIVIDEDAKVLAGNATIAAAIKAGFNRVQVVDADGRTLVAVRRVGLSDEQKARLALFDNRAAELADGWNTEILKQLQDEGVSLDGLWSEQELADVLAAGGDEFATGLTDPDDVPPVRSTSIRLGELFELGQHRLLCGDSTRSEDVARVLAGRTPMLMVTDPPYGVEYDPEWRKTAGLNKSGRTGKVTNDDRADWSPAWALFPGHVAYVYHAALFASIVDRSLTSCGFSVRAQIIWRKPRFVLSRGHYHWQHEPCLYAVRKGKSANWSGRRNQATVWDAGSAHRCPACGTLSFAGNEEEVPPGTIWDIAQKDDTGQTMHGTQKPVECMARAMRNHMSPEVYEPFSGSGSSLIAAEQLGRRCYAIELEPSYVQQAIDRWEQFTGQKAKKVAEVRRGGKK